MLLSHVFFRSCNGWGRGAFDEGHQEQVSLDGAFGEHVIITTGGAAAYPPIYWENWRKRKLCTISSRSGLHLTLFCRGGIEKYISSKGAENYRSWLYWVRWGNTPLMCPFYKSQRKRGISFSLRFFTLEEEIGTISWGLAIPHICHEPTSEACVNFFWPV